MTDKTTWDPSEPYDHERDPGAFPRRAARPPRHIVALTLAAALGAAAGLGGAALAQDNDHVHACERAVRVSDNVLRAVYKGLTGDVEQATQDLNLATPQYKEARRECLGEEAGLPPTLLPPE